jgi:hypothetical protein
MDRIRQKQPSGHSRLLVLLVAVTFTPLALPGQDLLNAGQHRLFLSCTGQRHGPVVIFEGGQGRSREDWSKVQPEAQRLPNPAAMTGSDWAKALWLHPSQVLPPKPRTSTLRIFTSCSSRHPSDLLILWSATPSEASSCAASPQNIPARS